MCEFLAYFIGRNPLYVLLFNTIRHTLQFSRIWRSRTHLSLSCMSSMSNDIPQRDQITVTLKSISLVEYCGQLKMIEWDKIVPPSCKNIEYIEYVYYCIKTKVIFDIKTQCWHNKYYAEIETANGYERMSMSMRQVAWY